MPKNIPDRWIPYKACGSVIPGTNLICFKVPIKRTYQEQNRAIKSVWDIPAMVKKIPNLGAVIDLTNTNKYYDPKEIEEAGILHKKILIPGRELPSEDKVTELSIMSNDDDVSPANNFPSATGNHYSLKTFNDAVDKFKESCKPNSLIGVHCTHGLNRTGYLVCRYMRDRLGVPAKVAIDRFQKARGYEIERKNYIADLLGLEPTEPDLGKKTIIKPMKIIEELSWRKRPHDGSIDTASRSFDSYKSKRSKVDRKSPNKKPFNKESNWRQEKGKGDQTSKNFGSYRIRDMRASFEYDYKYDY